jgi:hypothetical protein
MEFARRLQSHLNQVLLNRQKFNLLLNPEDFLEIHLKIKQFLVTLNEAFGFIFLMTFLEIFGSMIPEIYKSILTIALSETEISLNLLIYTILNFIWASFSYYHLGQFAFECGKVKYNVSFLGY